jgi:xylulokinase
MYLLGVDVGTTSIKAAVFNKIGEQISSSTVDYTLIIKGDYIEFDADQYWVLFQQCMKEAVGNLDVSALSIDTQCETMILTDDKGNPLDNAIVWLDNRATNEATEIEKVFGNKSVYETTGQPEVTATWPACKLLWIKRNKPDIWKKTKKIFLLEDYLLFKLTGKFVTEKTLQSSTLYFDIRNATWWKDMLDYIGVSEDMLPELHDSGKCIGYFNNIAVVTGAIDQIAGAIGAGIIKKGIISEMTGTTMVLFIHTDEIPPYNPDSKIPCHYNVGGTYCLVLWTITAGMALKWFRNNFCEEFNFKELDELAKNIPVGSDGLVMLPHLSGSMMPKYNPDAKGVFYGITLEHTRGHFVRSILEAVSCMLKNNLDYLGMDISEIRSMGGGANSELWCQMKSDMTNTKLVTLKHKETACLGSAILAGVGIGVFSSVKEGVKKTLKTDKVYSPSGLDYEKTYKRYCELDEILNKQGIMLSNR